MAKAKTAKEIKEEASRVMSDAKKAHRELMKKALDMEEKKYSELGKKCVEFLKGKVTQSDLKTIAVNSDLLEKVAPAIVEESDEEKNEGEL